MQFEVCETFSNRRFFLRPASGFAKLQDRVVDNEHREHDEGDREDPLEPVHHEDEIPRGDRLRDLDELLDQSRHRDGEHHGHRAVEHPTFAARRLQENREARQNESGEE